jgi:transposase
MVSAVRRGQSQRQVAKRFGVRLRTVQKWLAKAAGQRLDRVSWESRSTAPHRTRRTPAAMERKILAIREHLRRHSALGEFGAAAILRELQAQQVAGIPSLRTIGRILQRQGVLDGRRRVRRPAPLPGWYLPPLAAAQVELDSFDTIEDLAIRSGPHLTILTGVALHSGLPMAWPERSVLATTVVTKLVEHWRVLGLPAYVQFDNDHRFQGPQQYADVVGRVSRLCLSLGVTPVFVPPRETGFQAAIESFNGRWQAKVWQRFEHRSLRTLRSRSARYVEAVRERLAARIEAAPQRRPFPRRWQLNLQKHPQGTLIYIRRTDARGQVSLLGHGYKVARHWTSRLVRAEIDLTAEVIRIYALRRREPTQQPMPVEYPYHLPKRPFKE